MDNLKTQTNYMKTIKWSARILKNIFAMIEEGSSEWDEWLAEKGSEYLQEYARKKGIGIFGRLFGTHKKMLKEEFKETITSESLKAALENFNQKVPKIIFKISEKCKSVPTEHRDIIDFKAKPIPSDIISVTLKKIIENEFASSSELINTDLNENLIENFLHKVIDETLNGLDKEIQKDSKGVNIDRLTSILYKNTTQHWGDNKLKGHYYVVKGKMVPPEHNSTTSEMINKIEIKLGKYDEETIETIYRTLESELGLV